MSKITSPLEVVERAKAATLSAALVALLSPPRDSTAEKVVSAAARVRDLFPHVDSATHVAILDYFADLLARVAEAVKSGELPDDTIPVLGATCSSLALMMVELGETMLDEIDADNKAKADEALSALSAKLRGESPQNAGDLQEARLAAERDASLGKPKAADEVSLADWERYLLDGNIPTAWPEAA